LGQGLKETPLVAQTGSWPSERQGYSSEELAKNLPLSGIGSGKMENFLKAVWCKVLLGMVSRR